MVPDKPQGSMTFEYEEALYRLGLLPGERLPDVAIAMLEAGFDSQAIRELAGLSAPTRRDAGPLFEEALEAVRAQRISVDDAPAIVRDRWISDIAEGREEPLRGVARLNSIWRELGYPADLAPFVYLSDLVGEEPDHARETVEEMIELARKLASQRSSQSPPQKHRR